MGIYLQRASISPKGPTVAKETLPRVGKYVDQIMALNEDNVGEWTGVPPLEASQEKRYGKDPAFRLYKETTSLIVPWFKLKPAPPSKP